MPKTEKPEKFSALSGADVADLLGVTVKTVRNWMNSRLRLDRRAHPRSAAFSLSRARRFHRAERCRQEYQDHFDHLSVSEM